MNGLRVLVTGDYWHSDFKSIVRRFDVPVTLVPVTQLKCIDSERECFDLIVIAQSRRGQLTESIVDLLFDRFPSVPLVSLLGSWCEGETRSGEPFAGLIRVYWHQWLGRYESFRAQLESLSLANWHLPRTATVADRIANQPRRTYPRRSHQIGVSSWSQASFEALADALDVVGYSAFWLESQRLEENRQPAAMLIDGNSLTDGLRSRIMELRESRPDSTVLLTLNFPRTDEVQAVEKLGVAGVISKPFELGDLKSVLDRTLPVLTSV